MKGNERKWGSQVRLDIFLVLCGFTELVLDFVPSASMLRSMSLLRLLRLVRVFRLLKLFRKAGARVVLGPFIRAKR